MASYFFVGVIPCLLQAQLLDLREELCEVQANKSILEKELHNQLLQFHAVQLQLHAKTGQTVESDAIKKKLVGVFFLCA